MKVELVWMRGSVRVSAGASSLFWEEKACSWVKGPNLQQTTLAKNSWKTSSVWHLSLLPALQTEVSKLNRDRLLQEGQTLTDSLYFLYIFGPYLF